MRLESTSFGTVTVDGKKHETDIVLTGNTLRPRDYSVSKNDYGTSHKIGVRELETIIGPETKTFFLGKGQSGMAELTAEAKQWLREKNIKVVEKNTPQILKDYNDFSEKNQAAALIHTTC